VYILEPLPLLIDIFDAKCLRNETTYIGLVTKNTNRDLHTPYSRVSLRMTLTDLE